MGENKYKFLIIKLNILYEHYKRKKEITITQTIIFETVSLTSYLSYT